MNDVILDIVALQPNLTLKEIIDKTHKDKKSRIFGHPFFKDISVLYWRYPTQTTQLFQTQFIFYQAVMGIQSVFGWTYLVFDDTA